MNIMTNVAEVSSDIWQDMGKAGYYQISGGYGFEISYRLFNFLGSQPQYTEKILLMLQARNARYCSTGGSPYLVTDQKRGVR